MIVVLLSMSSWENLFCSALMVLLCWAVDSGALKKLVDLWRWMTFRRFLIFFFVIVVPLSIALNDLIGDVLFCSVLMVFLCWVIMCCALKPVERLWRSTCLQTTSVDPMHDSGA